MKQKNIQQKKTKEKSKNIVNIVIADKMNISGKQEEEEGNEENTRIRTKWEE